MTKHFNRLTPGEAERLAILAEECGEVIKVIGKVLRHGYESHNPDAPGETNRQMLERECGHVRHSIDRLIESLDLEFLNIRDSQALKRDTIIRYLHHA